MERRSSAVRVRYSSIWRSISASIQDRALDDVRVVHRQRVLHRGDVGDGATHADQRIHRRPAIQADEVRGDCGHGLPHHRGRHDPTEAELLRVPHGAHVHAEALVDAVALPEGELGAAATGVEHRQRALGQPDACLDGEVGEAALLLAGDHLDPDAGPGCDGLDHGIPVARDPQAGGSHRGDRERPVRLRLGDHAGDRVRGTRHGLVRDLAALLQALAEPGDLGPIDDGPPGAVSGTLAHVELDGVGAGVDHRIARRRPGEQPGQALAVRRVDVVRQAHPPDRLDDRGGVGGLDGDRPGRDAVGGHVRDLRGAAADRVPDPSLVDIHCAERPARAPEVRDQLVDRVRLAGERRGGQAERVEHGADVGGGERERRLHDRTPLLQPVGVGLHERLDVHQVEADLDGGTRLVEEVDLVALLDAGGRQPGDSLLGRAERRPEGPPLPARDDRGHVVPSMLW